jgi:sulfatase maturation enzyme AslB (radical SAM superfamily)
MSNNYLPPKNPMLHEKLEKLFNTGHNNKKATLVTFQVTENCCMACTYCYQLNKQPHKMTFEIAKKFIDDLLTDKNELINRSNTMTLCLDFIGGEPFLEVDLIE